MALPPRNDTFSGRTLLSGNAVNFQGLTVLASAERPKPPFAARFFNWFPVLRRIPARLIGLGVRPEHIRTPEVPAS